VVAFGGGDFYYVFMEFTCYKCNSYLSVDWINTVGKRTFDNYDTQITVTCPKYDAKPYLHQLIAVTDVEVITKASIL
jgi:hypothetical protein